jgi:hypothetical protein
LAGKSGAACLPDVEEFSRNKARWYNRVMDYTRFNSGEKVMILPPAIGADDCLSGRCDEIQYDITDSRAADDGRVYSVLLDGESKYGGGVGPRYMATVLPVARLRAI